MMTDRRSVCVSTYPAVGAAATSAAIPRRPADGEPRTTAAAGRVRTSPEAAAPAGRRSALLVSGGANLGTMAFAPATRAPRDRHRLAPHCVAAVLDMEESPQASRATPHRSRTARADCPAA